MEDHVRLHLPRKDGSTLIGHAESILAATGVWPKEIPEPPTIPTEMQHIWEWFWELRTASPSGFSGPVAILYSEMESWARLTGTELSPWHIDIIRSMDSVYLDVANGEKRKEKKK